MKMTYIGRCYWFTDLNISNVQSHFWKINWKQDLLRMSKLGWLIPHPRLPSQHLYYVIWAEHNGIYFIIQIIMHIFCVSQVSLQIAMFHPIFHIFEDSLHVSSRHCHVVWRSHRLLTYWCQTLLKALIDNKLIKNILMLDLSECKKCPLMGWWWRQRVKMAALDGFKTGKEVLAWVLYVLDYGYQWHFTTNPRILKNYFVILQTQNVLHFTIQYTYWMTAINVTLCHTILEECATL